jgi:glycosyltransferase involved in cell wall biosynthesis
MEPSCQEQKAKISVVIPTLNAAHLLPPLLGQLQGMGEVILADGGSADEPRKGAA